MTNKRKCVAITPATGTRSWEIPSALWSRFSLVQKARLKRTVTQYILPILQDLETLYLQENLGAHPRIAGRTPEEIEQDDIAIEACLYLFDLAMQEGLIEFRALDEKGKQGAPITKGKVGSCGFTIEEAKTYYLNKAIQILLEQDTGRKNKDASEQLKGIEIETVADLQSIRKLIRFDPLTVKELHLGLKGRLEPLLRQDQAYLDILHKCKPITFLRALRHALGNNFSEILKWDPEFIVAVAEGLDHSAKITALGPEILSIEDPAVIRAFGTWPVKEAPPTPGKTNKKKYITRIAQVKEAMGSTFTTLLTANPATVEEIAHWSNQQIEEFLLFIPHLDNEILEVLSTLPFEMRVSMLEGLWDRLGREFVENELKTPEGISVVRHIVEEVTEMLKMGPSAKNVKRLLTQSSSLDHTIIQYLNKAD